MSVVFLDTATALRRYEAISVGDASPWPEGISVAHRNGDSITFTVRDYRRSPPRVLD